MELQSSVSHSHKLISGPYSEPHPPIIFKIHFNIILPFAPGLPSGLPPAFMQRYLTWSSGYYFVKAQVMKLLSHKICSYFYFTQNWRQHISGLYCRLISEPNFYFSCNTLKLVIISVYGWKAVYKTQDLMWVQFLSMRFVRTVLILYICI